MNSNVPNQVTSLTESSAVFFFEAVFSRSFQIFFYVHPYLGKGSLLTSIIFKWVGKNHQPKVNLPKNHKMVDPKMQMLGDPEDVDLASEKLGALPTKVLERGFLKWEVDV